MTTIRVHGVYFRLYPADHEPRHVHGNYGETTAIVDLLDGGSVALSNRSDRVIPANARRTDVKKILNLAKRHFQTARGRMGENALMNKSTARVLTSDEEIDAAIVQAKLYDEYRPKAASVKYLRTTDSFAIRLATGVEIVIPRKLLQGLDRATPAQLADVRIVAAKSGLYWKALDVDHYIPSLIEGVFGNRRWMSAIGRKGGGIRSAAKTRAVRENGRKGGRPKSISALRTR